MEDLIKAHGFTAEDLERVDVHAPAMHLKNLMYQRPTNGLEGKFSIEYPLACLITDGNCTLADFSDDALQRPAHRAMMERIHRHPIERPETEVNTTIAVTLRDGRKLERSVFMPRGSKAAPYPTSQYWDKFDQCTLFVMPQAQQAELRQALENFPGLERAHEFSRLLGIDIKPAGSSGPV